jgi:uncharacterized membrane protein
MSPTLVGVLVVFLLGVWVGYRAGIARAEAGSAWFAMKRTWRGRADWRS